MDNTEISVLHSHVCTRVCKCAVSPFLWMATLGHMSCAVVLLFHGGVTPVHCSQQGLGQPGCPESHLHRMSSALPFFFTFYQSEVYIPKSVPFIIVQFNGFHVVNTQCSQHPAQDPERSQPWKFAYHTSPNITLICGLCFVVIKIPLPFPTCLTCIGGASATRSLHQKT